MKKIFCILCALLLLTACGKSEIVANKKLVCNFRSSVDNQTLVSKVIIKYDSESGKVIKGTFLTEYDNLAQNETNNSIKLKYGDRKYKIREDFPDDKDNNWKLTHQSVDVNAGRLLEKIEVDGRVIYSFRISLTSSYFVDDFGFHIVTVV